LLTQLKILIPYSAALRLLLPATRKIEQETMKKTRFPHLAVYVPEQMQTLSSFNLQQVDLHTLHCVSCDDFTWRCTRKEDCYEYPEVGNVTSKM
jgi:hypothetical protein